MSNAGILSAASSHPNLVFHGTFTDTANNASTRTFSSVPFGNPASDRRIAIGAVSYGSGPGYPVVTIGGVTATGITSAWMGSNGIHVKIMKADVPTGLSGDILFSPIANSDGVIIGVWSYSRLDPTPVTDYKATNFYPNTTDTIDYADNGAVFGVCGGEATAAGQFSLDFDHEDFDTYSSTNGLALWGGVHFPAVAATAQTVTASFGSNTECCWASTSLNPE